jgi:uncharacterized membrane protein YeaQ/YmgE (transglycosylase-associated protein family)
VKANSGSGLATRADLGSADDRHDSYQKTERLAVWWLIFGLGGNAMEEHQIGWIAAIIIGGIAGWLAEQFMKSQMGLVMNIVLGVIGAAVASWLLSFFGISFGGWIGYLIAGFIGACILIAIARAFSGGFQRT